MGLLLQYRNKGKSYEYNWNQRRVTDDISSLKLATKTSPTFKQLVDKNHRHSNIYSLHCDRNNVERKVLVLNKYTSNCWGGISISGNEREQLQCLHEYFYKIYTLHISHNDQGPKGRVLHQEVILKINEKRNEWEKYWYNNRIIT